MLTCFNVQKTHSSMPRHSQMRCFLHKPLLPTSTVCSDWPTDRVHCDWPNIVTRRKCNAPFRNFISSSPKGEQSRVTDTVMMLVCICSIQAAVKTISDGLYTPLWCDPVPLTHTRRKTPLFEQSIANTWTKNKTYLQSLIQKRQIVKAKSNFFFFIYFFLIAFMQTALYCLRLTKRLSIKFVA